MNVKCKVLESKYLTLPPVEDKQGQEKRELVNSGEVFETTLELANHYVQDGLVEIVMIEEAKKVIKPSVEDVLEDEEEKSYDELKDEEVKDKPIARRPIT